MSQEEELEVAQRRVYELEQKVEHYRLYVRSLQEFNHTSQLMSFLGGVAVGVTCCFMAIIVTTRR